MGQELEHQSRLAICFENAANDETLPLDQRVEFARKANWLRILARLASTEPVRCQKAAPELTALAAALPPDAQLSSFKLDLLLRHYARGGDAHPRLHREDGVESEGAGQSAARLNLRVGDQHQCYGQQAE